MSLGNTPAGWVAYSEYKFGSGWKTHLYLDPFDVVLPGRASVWQWGLPSVIGGSTIGALTLLLRGRRRWMRALSMGVFGMYTGCLLMLFGTVNYPAYLPWMDGALFASGGLAILEPGLGWVPWALMAALIPYCHALGPRRALAVCWAVQMISGIGFVTWAEWDAWSHWAEMAGHVYSTFPWWWLACWLAVYSVATWYIWRVLRTKAPRAPEPRGT